MPTTFAQDMAPLVKLRHAGEEREVRAVRLLESRTDRGFIAAITIHLSLVIVDRDLDSFLGRAFESGDPLELEIRTGGQTYRTRCFLSGRRVNLGVGDTLDLTFTGPLVEVRDKLEDAIDRAAFEFQTIEARAFLGPTREPPPPAAPKPPARPASRVDLMEEPRERRIDLRGDD